MEIIRTAQQSQLSRFTIFLVCLLAFTSLSQAQNVSSSISSKHLLVGESCTYRLEFENANPSTSPNLEHTEGLSIATAGRQQNSSFRGPSIYNYLYRVTANAIGDQSIDELTFTLPNKKRFVLLPTDVTVHSPNSQLIKWQTAKLGRNEFRYGTAVFVPTLTPYEGQSFPVELKIYLPANVAFDNNLLPEVTLEGFNAHRFDPQEDIGSVTIRGQSYRSISFRSLASALKSGTGKIGGGASELVIGYNRTRIRGRLLLNFPELDFTIKPLPAGAPADFTGAVGTFTLESSADLEDTEPGSPISLSLTLSGKGNLDIAKVPKIEDPSGWKLYPATRTELGDIRHEGSGSINFTQFIRPTSKKTDIPPFLFSYFDPVAESYNTLKTASIPLPEALQKLKLATTAGNQPGLLPPAAVGQPIEEMLGPLGIIDPLRNPKAATWPPQSSTPSYLWHIIPLLIIAALLFPIIKQRISQSSSTTPLYKKHATALDELAKSQSDSSAFYRSVGKLIESTPVLADSDATQSILQKRDELCFQGKSADSQVPIDERKNVTETIRNLLLKTRFLIPLALLFLLQPIQAVTFDEVEKAFSSGDFEEVINLYEKSSRNTPLTSHELYNIGTSYARLDAPGMAALYFRRTLALDPTHPEAQQNLRFIERTQGSITPLRAGWTESLTIFSKGFYTFWLQLGIWVIVISLLLFIFYPHRRGGALLIAAFSLLLIAASSIGMIKYPNYGNFRNQENLTIVTARNAIALTEPTTTGNKVISATPGSLCQVIAHRGDWSYISFPTGTRGWLKSDQITKIVDLTSPAQ